MSITKTNKLNMTGGAVPLVIHLSQYDADFTLVFDLYNTDGTFTIESGTTAEIKGTKASGTGYSATATLDISNKKVTVTGNAQMTAVKGRNIYELGLVKSGKRLHTANFILEIEPAALDADTITDESVLKELNAIIESAEISTEAATQAVNAANSVSQSVDQIARNMNDITELKESVNYYTETTVSVSASPEGWRLDGSGKCVEASDYKLVKYEVSAGDILHLILSKDVTDTEEEGVYQWQNGASVPSSLPNNNLIGTPVTNAVNSFVEVPSGATWLVVSQFKNNTTNSVKLATLNGTVKGEITSLNDDVNELNEKVDSIEPGLSSEAKAALLACIEHVKWNDEHGQSYYDDLYNALYGVQPDPEVPNAYTRYDYIRLKKWSEVPSGTYEDSSDPESRDVQNVGLYKEGIIKTAAYSDLNQLNIKAKVGTIPSSQLSSSKNSCVFGGGTSADATSRIGLYLNLQKQWLYLMMHGVERQFVQQLQDVNTIEIIQANSSPSTLKINGTSHSFAWSNSNIINSPIALFVSYNFLTNPNVGYAGAFSKTGEIEITDQNNVMISKLIPVVRKADNVIGIYDSIRKEFYTASTLSYATIGNASCVYDVGNWA